ncbi:MAG: hypothetical protein RLY43_211 [Bacteroidota bacterium]|jgi:hypothetical protein
MSLEIAKLIDTKLNTVCKVIYTDVNNFKNENFIMFSLGKMRKGTDLEAGNLVLEVTGHYEYNVNKINEMDYIKQDIINNEIGKLFLAIESLNIGTGLRIDNIEITPLYDNKVTMFFIFDINILYN